MPPNFDPYNLMGGFQAKNVQRQSQADAYNKATREGTVKNLLATKKAEASSALEALKHKNIMGQHALQYGHMLARRDKGLFDPAEQASTRALHTSNLFKNYGGLPQIMAQAGVGLHIPGMAAQMRGDPVNIGQFVKKVPTVIREAAAGKDVASESLDRLVQIKKDGKTVGFGKQRTKHQTTRKAPPTKPSANRQSDAARNFLSSNKGSTVSMGKSKRGFKFPGMKDYGPVVGPDGSGRYWAIDTDGRYIDVTSLGK
jgi:hypothetical protein